MADRGQQFSLNGAPVPSPDEEAWSNFKIGDSIAGTQRRSPYRQLQWRMQVADRCHMDWFDYDNTQLTSIVCSPPGQLGMYERYTDAFCLEVGFRKRHDNGTEVVATFLVNVG